MVRRHPQLYPVCLAAWMLLGGVGGTSWARRPAAAPPPARPLPLPLSRPTSAPASAPTSRRAAPNSRPARPAERAARAGDPFAGLDHTGTPAGPAREAPLPRSSAEPGKKRPLPDYDGRAAEPLSAGEVLIWIPRALFYPAHLLLEYGLRWPTIKLVTWAEKHHLFARVRRFFTFADGRAALFPTLFFDFGINPSLGLYFYFNDIGVKDHNLVLQAGYWFNNWYNFVATDSFKVFRNDQGTVTLRGRFLSRPDRVFHGIGPNTRDQHESFFRLRRTEAEASLRATIADLNRVSLAVRYTNARISGGDTPSIDDPNAPFDLGDPTDVPGYLMTYNLLSARLQVELDSRSPDRVYTHGSGLRLELFGSFSFAPDRTELNFFRWGGEAAGFLDLSGRNHVLALRVYAEALERTGDALVPLSELITLGGDEYLRGFLEGRWRGDSALVVSAQYRYPIWFLLDANIFVSAGNVFDGRWENLHPERMVMCWGLGLRTNTSRDVSFDLLVALGTNQFGRWDDAFSIDHVRVLFGINQGF